MSIAEIELALLKHLATERGGRLDDVRRDLDDTGVIDSLEGLELAMEAERTFAVTISDAEISSDLCRSVPAIAALVGKKLGSNGNR